MQIQTHTYMQVYKYIQTTYVRRYTHTQSTQLQVLGDDYEYPDKFKEHIYSYNYYLDAHEQTSILDTNVRSWTKCVGLCIVGVALVNPVGIPSLSTLFYPNITLINFWYSHGSTFIQFLTFSGLHCIGLYTILQTHRFPVGRLPK